MTEHSGVPDRDCPYPGLRPFETSEAELFFGRTFQVNDMLGRLERAHFLAVVGVSGCGKSSLVQAGLIPAINDGYLTGPADAWRIACMCPGHAPFAALTQALLRPRRPWRCAHRLTERARGPGRPALGTQQHGRVLGEHAA